MKALRKTAPGKGHISLVEIPVPRVGAEEVLVKVIYAAVCGTDVHLEHDRFANTPPFTLGHEFSGVIEAIGERVSTLEIGDRVVSANNPHACGSCDICRPGHPNLCPHKKAMGIHSDGCFAEYVKLPATLVHRIPRQVTLKQACLMEPLAVATHAVTNRCGIDRNDNVVVFGAGAIGLLAAQVARAEGARTVLLAGTTRDEQIRFPCARQLAIDTLNVEENRIEEHVRDRINALGMDVVVEASGSPAAIGAGLSLLKRTGRMVISGITGRPEIPVNWDALTAKGATLFFCYSSVNQDWEKGLCYLAEKQVETLPLITHAFRIEQWKDAFRALDDYSAIRPVFAIGEDDEQG